MKFSYTYEIQPQEVDQSRKLRLYTLENYLLNVAGKAADEQGFGIRHLLPYGYTWVITRLNLEMTYLPTHNEILRFETWVEQNSHMLSVRNYRIYLQTTDKSEQPTERLIGQAKSVWAVLNLHKREIVNAFELPMFDNTVDGDTLDITKAARLLPITDPDGEVPHIIQYSDCDYNGHCNSCKYLERMLDAKCPNVENFCIRLAINYVKEVHLSDHICTRYKADLQDVQYQQVDENGKTVCAARISLFEKPTI
ncbi:MAG: thioesterase [Paludibacteraceae bacterium]|nr:thioesterase [Paludibacteraceae bacterium]